MKTRKMICIFLNNNQPSKIEATTFTALHMKEKDIEDILRKKCGYAL